MLFVSSSSPSRIGSVAAGFRQRGGRSSLEAGLVGPEGRLDLPQAAPGGKTTELAKTAAETTTRAALQAPRRPTEVQKLHQI